MAIATNDKVIRIRSDISEPLADIKKLTAAYTSLGGVNPALAAMVNNLNAAGAASGRAGAAAAAANNNVRSLTGNLGGLGNAANAALSRLSGMTGALGGIATAGAALGVTAVVGGLVALGTAAVKASAEMESYRASLTTILGDQDKAAQAMDRLVEFAQKTPFALNQAVEGFTKLKALGLQPTEAAMMSYGNTASALGKDLNQMVEAVADAATGEFERLKEFGIKSSKEGGKVKFTFQGVTKEVANNSTAIQGYLMGIGNVNFAGAMEKQMMTFNGAMSNLEDTWNQTLAAIGDGGLNTSVAKVINLITSGITGLTPILVAVGNVMGGVVDGVASIASGFGNLFTGITSNGGRGLTFIEGLTVALNITGQAAQVVGNIVGASLGAIGTVAGAVTNTVRSLFSELWDWLGVSSAVSGQTMGAGFLAALRAAKFVAANLQTIFSTALGAIGGSFAIVGQRIAAFLAGNYNAFGGMGGALRAQFASAGEVLNGIAVKANAIANDSKGAAAAWDRLKGGTGKKGGATLDQLAGAAPTPDASAGKADKDAAKKAADRAKREADFWQSLKDQLATAGMLSNAADVYNKQLEYRKIIERDLTAGEQARVATALNEINSAKAITGLKQKQFEAANEYTVELGRAKGLTDTQRGVEDDLFKARLDALNKGVDINSTAYKLAENDLKKQLDKNAALKVQNDLLAKAKDFASSMSPGARAAGDLATLNSQYKAWQDSVAAGTMSDTFRDQIVAGFENAKLKIEQDAIRLALDMSPTADRNARTATANGNLKEALAGLSSMGLSPEVRKRIEDEIYNSHSRALGKIASETTREWVEQFDDLADYFGGKMGGVLSKIADGFDAIADMMSGKFTGPAGMFAKIFKTEDTYQKAAEGFSAPAIGKALGSPLKSLSDGFGDFKSMFSGNLATGLTKGLSKLQAGSAVGGMVGGIGDMLGLGKGFSTGSSIGGAIGGLFGPIGSIVGSIGGGLIGSLFGKSKPQASAGFSVVDGKATGGLATGKGSGARDTASALASNVADGLNKVAAELGGSIGSLSGVSVGYRPGHKAGAYRVDTTGRGNLTGVAAFETEAEAIDYAIKDAIADGAITGLAPIIQKALSGLGADAAIAFAKDWKAAMNDYQSLIDPVAAGVSAIIDPLNALRATMVKVGASTEDLTKIDDYRTIKLKAALKEQLSSLNDFMSSLKGEGSGITKMDQLNAKMAEFDSYKTRVSNGDSNIDQAAFTSLGQSIFGLAGDIYGTATAEFQSYRTMLMGVTQGLTDNVSNAFGKAAGYDVANTATSIDNTTAAIQAQAAQAAAHYQAQAASNALQESWLKQIAANTANNGSSGFQSANDDVAMNGRYGGSTY